MNLTPKCSQEMGPQSLFSASGKTELWGLCWDAMVQTPLLLELYIPVMEIPHWLLKDNACTCSVSRKKTAYCAFTTVQSFWKKIQLWNFTSGSVRQAESILCQTHTKHKQQCWIAAYVIFFSCTEFLICSWVFPAPQFTKTTKVIFPVS